LKYEKPPLSIEDQIDLLIKRGLSVSDRPRAIQYLKHISYYRLRIYWAPFEIDLGFKDHQFKPWATFDNALDLYLFDRKFRLLIFEAIERFEISLRTQIVNHLATSYGSHAYMDKLLFRKGYDGCLASTEETISNSREIWIKHYKEKYKDPPLPPIWSVFEILSFGQLVKWYQVIKARKNRNAIADAYKLDGKVLGSFLNNLNHVRNIAAHHGRLWNRNLTFQITFPKNPEEISACFNEQAASKKKIYNTLVMLVHLLSTISPKTSWPTRVNELVNTLHVVSPGEMGFPEEWKSLSIWSGNNGS